MSQMIEGPRKTYLAAAAIGVNLRVKITSGSTKPPTINVAGAADPSIGVTEAAVLAAGPVAILLTNAQGTKKMHATGAITSGNTVYAAAAGKVASSGTVVEGQAQETTTTTGDIFEVMPTHNSDIATAIVGTTAVGFEVDTDSSTPKIKLLSVAAGTGDFTTTLTPEGTLSGDNTITVPEADGDVLAAVALAQTLTNKTLAISSVDSITATPVAAAGSVTGDAAALGSTKTVYVSSDGAAKGVILETGTAGMIKNVINTSSTACEIYPATGGTLNGAAANASMVVPASSGVLCICSAADTWKVYDMASEATAS